MNMIAINTKESALGTQAPSKNLIRVAEKKSASMEPKKTTKHTARIMLLFQQRTITRDIKQVVTSITVMTANPAQI